MSSTNKTSLGLNMWEASDKPVRQDFVNDNVIIDEKIAKLNRNLDERLFFGAGAALQTKNGATWYRLQLNPDGSAGVFKSTDNGSTWPIFERFIMNSDLRNKITLADTGVFHITRQTVMEYSDYYAIAITIVPTATPTTDTPMLTFPKQLATCVLSITTGYANGITYASNNNQMFYRILSGIINDTTEIIINGIIPKA